MRKQSFLLISITFVSFAQVSASEETQYLQCSYRNDSLEKNFYWSIAPEDNIQKWDLGEKSSVKNALVMNNQKNIAWNEMGNPMGIFVLDKNTMRQSGTLLSNENQILDRWVSECSYLEKDEFLEMQLN